MAGASTKEQRDLVRQEIIDYLASRGHIRPSDEVAADLLRELDRNDLPAMPLPWVRAVAEAAAGGNAYVVSPLTRREADIPEPQQHDLPPEHPTASSR